MTPFQRTILSTRRITSLPLTRWYQASDLSTLFQDAAGTMPVTAATNPVQRMVNKVNGTAITQTTAGSIPTYQVSNGFPEVRFANDGLSDALAGLYAAGKCSVFFSVKAAPGITQMLFAEGSSVDGDPIYGVRSDGTTASTMAFWMRNDAAAVPVNVAPMATSALNNTIKVLGYTDDGSSIVPYVNGVAQTPIAYTRADPLTADLFCIGGLQRSTFTLGMTTLGLFEFISTHTVLSAADIALVTRELGRRVGLAL